MAYDKDDRDADDTTGTEGALAARLLFAWTHPDCPVLLLPKEAAQLARHTAIRLNRNRGRRVYVAGSGSRL